MNIFRKTLIVKCVSNSVSHDRPTFQISQLVSITAHLFQYFFYISKRVQFRQK